MKDSGLKILVADDDISNRLVLQTILQKQGYQILQASNGQEAVDIFKLEKPALVLMDIKMPVMDGYEATRQIKVSSGERFTPVIFLTATTDNEGLVKCIDSGGDDFLTKPYNSILLQARINALLRIRELYRTVQDQRNELMQHQERLDRERQLTKRIFTNIVDSGTLDLPYIKSLFSPKSLFSGDILLAAPKPSGGINILLGDFTGHGLAAATGALPVSSIFYGMTAKGYSIGEIVVEINAKLKTILPTGMFLAACVINLDPTTHAISVWNGGIPPVLILGGEKKKTLVKYDPRHVPLGVVDIDEFNHRVDVIPMHQGDRVYIASDGVTEAVNPQGELYGQQRLEDVFNNNTDPNHLYDEILASLAAFREGIDQQDDVTLIEVEYNQGFLDETINIEHNAEQNVSLPPTTWAFSIELGADLMRHFDPLPLLIQAVSEIQGFRGQQQGLFMVLSELFSNALDHGILKLDSGLKLSADGFAKYYKKRADLLSTLEEGTIKIKFAHKPRETGGELTIRIEDSGSGFDYTKGFTSLAENEGYSGRGVQLIRTRCEDLRFEGAGNICEVVYAWS